MVLVDIQVQCLRSGDVEGTGIVPFIFVFNCPPLHSDGNMIWELELFKGVFNKQGTICVSGRAV